MRFNLLPFSPRLIHARWEFGLLPCEELPRLAQDALELGYDGKYTARIAGLIQQNIFDLQPLITGFFAELGIKTTLTREQAGRTLARFIAQAIVDGQVQPYEGARFIGDEVAINLWGNDLDLRKEFIPFIGLTSEYEDCEAYSQHSAEIQQEIEQQIIENGRSVTSQPQ